MLAFSKKSPEHVAALDRVREWVRARFALGEDTAILVAEVACAVPGCPPIETVIAFWSERTAAPLQGVQAGGRGDRGRSAAALAASRALAVPDDFECDCC